MLTLDSFFIDFQNSVRASASAEGIFTKTAFVEEMSNRLAIAEEIDALITCEYEGFGVRKKKLAIDGYDFDDEEGQLVLAIVDYSSDDAIGRLITTEARKLFSNAEAFVQMFLSGGLKDLLEESSDIFQMVSEFKERLESISVIRLYLLTNLQLSESIKTFAPSEIGDLRIEYHLWDIERLFRVETSKTGREEIDIDITRWLPKGLAVLPASVTNSSVRTFLGVIPGETLADIYATYGSRVLESNVRSFLTARGKVNKSIRGTVLQEPEMFLSFNNGITATATSIDSNDVGGGTYIRGIRNLQIVNGGQTTASLFYAKKNDKANLRGVDVQLKLIVVDETNVEELVPKISRFANTQNRVSEADFFSNHPFHQRMEEKSRQILVPSQSGQHFQTKWFYERTRGQYLNERARGTAAEARKFETEYPKSQVITKTDAAKYLVSWLQRPQIVSSGAQKNFVAFADLVSKEWTTNDVLFGDDYFKELVGKSILFNSIRRSVSKAPWYSTGYLANIVTYTIAKFAHTLTQYRGGSELNFQIIWNLQAVPNELAAILDEISEDVFDVLTDEKRPVVNVTEWAKREPCWVRVRECEYDFPSEIDEYLMSRSEVREMKRQSAKSQKLDSGISSQVIVLDLGPTYWLNARDFALRMTTLSEKENSILGLVTSTTSQKIPSELQSKVLLEFRDRIEAIGYVGR